MFRRPLIKIASAASVAALATALTACGSSSSPSGTGPNAVSNVSSVPTVTLMVGGIDKQIYLPYQLAQDLGFYKKYGVNVQLSTEQNGGVGAETAMVSGQVDMAGAYPAAGVLARADWVASHQAVVQKVVDALVATMHWINTHSAADIANAMPAAFVSNGLTTKADYIAELAQDKGQFLADGMMPSSGPATVLAIEKFIGNVTGSINLATTYTNQYAIAANKLEGFTS